MHAAVIMTAMGPQQSSTAGFVMPVKLEKSACKSASGVLDMTVPCTCCKEAVGHKYSWGLRVVGLQIDDEDVEVLVELMKLPQPLGRQLLQRVFTNLCAHRQTRRTMLRLLVRLLRASGAVDDSSAAGGRTSTAFEIHHC